MGEDVFAKTPSPTPPPQKLYSYGRITTEALARVWRRRQSYGGCFEILCVTHWVKLAPRDAHMKCLWYQYVQPTAMAIEDNNRSIRGERRTGIEPYHKLVDLVMRQEPCRSARRVFRITDNGSSHRGESSIQQLAKW